MQLLKCVQTVSIRLQFILSVVISERKGIIAKDLRANIFFVDERFGGAAGHILPNLFKC